MTVAGSGPNQLANFGIAAAPAASNERKTGKTAEIGGEWAVFCRNRHSVCATQPAPTRVS
jgi:hypothetical protein